jgi:hypothetical protein
MKLQKFKKNDNKKTIIFAIVAIAIITLGGGTKLL